MDYYHIDKTTKGSGKNERLLKKDLINIVVNNTLCYSKYDNNLPIHVKIEWGNHVIYTQVRKCYDKYISFKKINDYTYEYKSYGYIMSFSV